MSKTTIGRHCANRPGLGQQVKAAWRRARRRAEATSAQYAAWASTNTSWEA